MNKPKISILWFRQDLRLEDNPALCAAVENGTLLPIYILDDETAGIWKMGQANRVWLHHSLKALSHSLGGKLSIYRGKADYVLAELTERFDVSTVYWNRCYEPWRIKRDIDIKETLTENAITVHSFNGSLLWEPWEISKNDGTPYRVFTPFYKRGCLSAQPPRAPLEKPENIQAIHDSESIELEALGLLPTSLRWHEMIEQQWAFGEAGAHAALDVFLENGIAGYKQGRDFPSRANTSRLSPYLQTGEISPHIVWHKAKAVSSGDDLAHFCSELGWREFSYSILYHFPDFPTDNFQNKFDTFPWAENDVALKAWQTGQTGVPIVDAGMRELWQTGYMHNRVRMIVASFLTKNLLMNWRAGAAWFWDTLVDADLANNSSGWQWVAGSGVDAAPYFRIFNPVTQGKKFDGQGHYIRKYVPELSELDDKYLFAPWEAPEHVLAQASIKLGVDYPKPVVDLASSRARALAAFKELQAI